MKEFEGTWGGHWRIDEEQLLGPPGGFGSVFQGWSAEGRQVAVKVIRGVLSNGIRLHPRLQEREVDIATKLRDAEAKHLIRILDVGRAEDDVLVVMELADGALAQAGGQTVESAVATLKDIAAGLQELHQA